MTKAQTAWTVLTALFLIAAVVMIMVPDPDTAGRTVAAGVCFSIAVLGWVVVGIMIMVDAGRE
jgi:hypothetical protein